MGISGRLSVGFITNINKKVENQANCIAEFNGIYLYASVWDVLADFLWTLSQIHCNSVAENQALYIQASLALHGGCIVKRPCKANSCKANLFYIVKGRYISRGPISVPILTLLSQNYQHSTHT